MKEKIVIDEDFYVKHFQDREKDFNEEQLCSGGNPEEWWHYKKEQVPTNWEELKNLCNENNLEILADIIYTNALSFHKNGDIKDNENSIVAVNRTPARMWNIIKNLIGEE